MAWRFSGLLLAAELARHQLALPVTSLARVLRVQDHQLQESADVSDRELQESSWPPRKSEKVRDPALSSRSPALFLEHYHCQREPVVEEALDFLRTSGVQLSRSFLTQQFESMQGDGVLFTIKNQSVAFEVDQSHPKKLLLRDRSHILQSMIADLLEEVELPDMQFLYNPMDGAKRGDYGVLKREGRPGKDLLAISTSLPDWGAQVQESASRPSWNCRQKPRSFAVFRGTTTGLWNLTCASRTSHRPCKLDDICCSSCTRARVLLSARSRPDLLDAGIIRVFGQYKAHSKTLTDVLRVNGLWKNFAMDAEQACYSAVVVVDGDALPDRLPRQLGYGIPTVFVHASATDEFWYPELKSGANFLSASPENLTQVLEVLRNDPDLGRRIGEQGREFVLSSLSERRLRCYLYALLTSYAKKYKSST
mmetsp:Transcript_123742/g.214508  ORF Transcript_123742/g.214508 Transcript_123742/m.214508 type:complete len:422 (+) Transcript_123742:51-1316(+)